MPTSYTSLLGLALPVQGELSGTWGDVVNNSITSLVDSAVAGTTTLSTDADVTLTTTTGAANTAREAILLCTGARTALRNITAPAQSKTYTVINATTGGFAVVIRGAGPTTGISVPAGFTAQVAWNGSDFVQTAVPVTRISGLGTGVATALAVNVGTAGSPVVNGGVLGTPSSGTLTNATGLPISTGVSGLGTGVATALAVNVGTAGSPVVNGGALGTPSSGTVTNLTGTANITATGGASGAIAATTLSASSTVSGTGFSTYLASPPAIGGTAPAAVSATALSYTTTLTGGTGIVNLGSGQFYKDASGKVGIGRTPTNFIFEAAGRGWIQDATQPSMYFGNTLADYLITYYDPATKIGYVSADGATTQLVLRTNSTERMRIDASGNVGIGVTPNGATLDVLADANTGAIAVRGRSADNLASIQFKNNTAATQYAFIQSGPTYLGIGVNSAERMRIDSNGNVLVGITTTPTVGTNVTKNLVVSNDISTGSLLMGTNGSFLGRQSSDGSTVLNTGQASIIFSRGVYGSAPTTSMLIDNSGNVGIGISNPGSKLDVNGVITGRATSGEGGQLELNNPDNLSTGLVLDVSSADTGRLFQTRNNSVLQIGQLAGTGGLIGLFTSGSERMRITSDGRVYGTALHNNAGSVTGTTTQYIASGTYTPTLTNLSTISSSTAYLCQWIRVGNVVTVSGRVDITASVAGFIFNLGVSFPIASTITATTNCAGTFGAGSAATTGSPCILGDTTNVRANFSAAAPFTSSLSYYFTFTYLVL